MKARGHMWAAWQGSSEELASKAAETLIGLGMLVPEGGAQELERLRAALREATEQIAELKSDLGGATARVAELEAERHVTNEALSDAAEQLRANRDRIAELEGDVRRLNTLRGDVALLIEKERGYGEECVDIGDLEAALALGSDEVAEAGGAK